MSVNLTKDQIYQLFPIIKDVDDSKIKNGIIEIITEIGNEMSWESFHDIPKNLGNEKNRSLVVHINGVTDIAIKMAQMYKETQNLDYDKDLLIASCLLHDISKPVESEPDLKKKKTITNEQQCSISKWTPFDGKEVTGWPISTIIRGNIVMRNDELCSTPIGAPIKFKETS